MGAIVVERKYFTCPSRESNPGCWIYRQTLYHVAVKAGFYRKAVEVSYIIPRPCDIVSTKIYDKCDDFDFEIVNFPFLDGDVPRSTSYGVYISQLIRFARASSYVADFNTRNKLLTQKLLKQGYRYHKLRKTFSKFYR